MKNIFIGLAASVAVVSISAGAFACSRLDSADSGASNSKGGIILAQNSGGQTGGSGKNNTIEEQTGKATSDAPGTMSPEEVQKKKDASGAMAPSVPDNRNAVGQNKGEENPANPTVK